LRDQYCNNAILSVLGEEERSDVSLSTFYVFDKESAQVLGRRRLPVSRVAAPCEAAPCVAAAVAAAAVVSL
jgi:hypothetical protein